MILIDGGDEGLEAEMVAFVNRIPEIVEVEEGWRPSEVELRSPDQQLPRRSTIRSSGHTATSRYSYLNVQLRSPVRDLAMCEGSPDIRLSPTLTEETLSAPHKFRHEAASMRRARKRLDSRTKLTVRG